MALAAAAAATRPTSSHLSGILRRRSGRGAIPPSFRAPRPVFARRGDVAEGIGDLQRRRDGLNVDGGDGDAESVAIRNPLNAAAELLLDRQLPGGKEGIDRSCGDGFYHRRLGRFTEGFGAVCG